MPAHRSVVPPAKALVCNVLSLTYVWRVGGSSRKAISVPWNDLSGTLVANMPVLLIAFGLSMDYVRCFLLRFGSTWLVRSRAIRAKKRRRGARQRRERRAFGVAPHRSGDHRGSVGDKSVVRRADRCARRSCGCSASTPDLAVAADATLVRMAVVPAFMHVTGRWNCGASRPWRGCMSGSVSARQQSRFRGRSHAGGLGKIAGRSDGQTIPAC